MFLGSWYGLGSWGARLEEEGDQVFSDENNTDIIFYNTRRPRLFPMKQTSHADLPHVDSAASVIRKMVQSKSHEALRVAAVCC